MATAKPKYPLSNSDLTITIKDSYAAGYKWAATFGLLQTQGYKTEQEIIAQLVSAGWNASEISHYLRDPPELSSILGGLGQGALLIPGALATGAAGEAAGGASAAEGAAGGAGAATAASKLVGSGLLAGLGSLSDWQELAIRALEALAGAALILLGLQALTGTGSGNPVDAVASVRKVVR